MTSSGDGGGSEATNTTLTYFNFEGESDLRGVYLSLELVNDPPDSREHWFLTLFADRTIISKKWDGGKVYDSSALQLNLLEYKFQQMIASYPIIFIIRAIALKASKQDPDPLLHTDNVGCGTVDLLPLFLGEEQINTTVHLVSLATGKPMGCNVVVRVMSPGTSERAHLSPVVITMISANCMPPPTKEGTVYMSAIGLSHNEGPKAVQFGKSLSTSDAEKLVWATASNASHGVNTGYNVPDNDAFVPEDLDPKTTNVCLSYYWNAVNRVIVDTEILTERLSSPIPIEVAGVPRVGKVDVRGRYMGWIDASVLLEPAQYSVTVFTKLIFFNEAELQDVLLDLPPTSAKGASARDNLDVLDEFEHASYVTLKLDLMESLCRKIKLITLYETLGFPIAEGPMVPVNQLDIESVPDDTPIDARNIRTECGALAVHKELSNLKLCRGAVSMDQSIKRTAASRLLARLRIMLRNFDPGDCSKIDWQDTVTGQQSACRRAVTASFAPQAPPLRVPERTAMSRCLVARDNKLAEKHMQTALKIAGSHPRSLICKTIRCLEERNNLDARNYLFEALNQHSRNKYLLFILGAQEYDQEGDGPEIAETAFRICVRSDRSDGTGNAIAWAALHTYYHVSGNVWAAHIAATNMRHAFSFPKEFDKVLARWIDASGLEEILWYPSALSCSNPFVLAAAFFLCFRCYKFAEELLRCVDKECATRGSTYFTYEPNVEEFYVKAVSLMLRRQLDEAMEVIDLAIKKYGPTDLMSQIRLTCLRLMRSWDDVCERAFKEAEKIGSSPSCSVLYTAALNTIRVNPEESLQRAARLYKTSPSGHSALVIGRIYYQMCDYNRGERWCAVAVNMEPCLPDGWAMLALIAMYHRKLDKARAMLRTARQVGRLSADVEADVRELMAIVKVDNLPDALVKNLCIYKY